MHLVQLFETSNDTDGFSQVSTNAKKYLLVLCLVFARMYQFKNLKLYALTLT